MTTAVPPARDAAPMVSVIIATYNSAATLHNALRSALAQDFQDFDVWIVGDGCTDDSEAVVNALGDSRLQWCNLPVNSGSQSAPNNEGLRLARGEYVAYLGHDDLWFPWHLSTLMASIDGADFVNASCLMLGPDGRRHVTGPMGLLRTHADQYTPPSSWLHRRNLAEQIGGWRDAAVVRCGVDLDFQRRAALRGFRCRTSPRISALKFPSAWWRNYAPSEARPQPLYLRRIQDAPLVLERELLQAIIVEYVREDNGARPLPALRKAVTALSRRLADGFGRDRWPVSAFLFWRQQRFRRRDRGRRGLPPLA
jgi:glycosyltransferase involved in cell wall biosynthesis